MTKPVSHTILLLTGSLFSIFAVMALPGFYFHKDLETFWAWSQAWNRGWQEIYVTCPECNYPIIGLFSSAGLTGLTGLLQKLGYEKAVFVFRLFLAFVDGLNVFLVYWILKKLSIEKAAFWAGVMGVSISSWVGGALWGQIDGVSQFFILATLAWIVKGNVDRWPSRAAFRIYLAGTGILLACILLTKQLTLFSVFSISLLVAANLLFYSRAWKQVTLHSALALAAFLATVSVWDLFLKLPAPYFSHLHYIVQEGVYRGDIISGNGFNLWMFLGRDMWSSAYVPLTANLPFFTPFWIGRLFFVIFVGLITSSLLLFLQEHLRGRETFLNREVILNFIFFLALVNLGFNIFLTGTHERYLYHFYPYIIVAVAGLESYSPIFTAKTRSLLVFGASFYGIFILMILSQIDFRLGYLPHWVMGIFHLGLLIYLTAVILRYQKFTARAVSLKESV
jgi:hypothetical protein